MKDKHETASELFFELREKTALAKKVYNFMKVLKIIIKYCLKEIEEQKRMCKTMESAEVINDLPEPLKTKEYKRYSELKKDSKELKNYLGEK